MTLLTKTDSYKLRINFKISKNLITLSAAFSRYLPQRGIPNPIAEPSENMVAAVEVAVGCLLAEAALMMLNYSLAHGTY